MWLFYHHKPCKFVDFLSLRNLPFPNSFQEEVFHLYVLSIYLMKPSFPYSYQHCFCQAEQASSNSFPTVLLCMWLWILAETHSWQISLVTVFCAYWQKLFFLYYKTFNHLILSPSTRVLKDVSKIQDFSRKLFQN